MILPVKQLIISAVPVYNYIIQYTGTYCIFNFFSISQGQTGYPWVDAIMTQLRKEGWIHNVARHAVACFLTRGDLWVSWEEGMKVRAGFMVVVVVLICVP